MKKSYAYDIFTARHQPEMQGCWDGAAWQKVPTLRVSNFRVESSSHRPCTSVKLLYSSDGLHGLFMVRDRYIRCIRHRFQDTVYKDSCVEFFVQPKSDRGYFNFEFNCGGTLLAAYIVDSTRVKSGFKEFTPLSPEDARQLQIFHSLPEAIDPEITDETLWFVEFYIPFTLFEKYVGLTLPVAGQIWRANFYKCADESSHPHWAAWAPVDELNFHLPRCFGHLHFQ